MFLGSYEEEKRGKNQEGQEDDANWQLRYCSQGGTSAEISRHIAQNIQSWENALGYFQRAKAEKEGMKEPHRFAADDTRPALNFTTRYSS